MLDLNGKIALITGGAAGIGLGYAKELLRSGVKGVTLADVNVAAAQTAVAEIEQEFGPNKAIFVKTDVSNKEQFEDAFKKTVEKFGHIDIVINNAGIMNDRIWEKEIAVNVNGVVNGTLLGLETYLPKYKQGPEAVIVNTASIAAVDILAGCPVYTATKQAVVALTRCWGDSFHYDRTKVRVFGICPGLTDTALVATTVGMSFKKEYDDWLEDKFRSAVSQGPEHVVKEVKKLIQSCSNGSIWIIEGNQPASEHIIPQRKK